MSDAVKNADKMACWLAQDPEKSDVKIETPPKLSAAKRHCPLHVGAPKEVEKPRMTIKDFGIRVVRVGKKKSTVHE